MCTRVFSATACEVDQDVYHFDVEQAFVQSKLGEDIFLRLPRRWGSVVKGKRGACTQGCNGTKDAIYSYCCVANLFTLACPPLSLITNDTEHLVMLGSPFGCCHVGDAPEASETLDPRSFSGGAF